MRKKLLLVIVIISLFITGCSIQKLAVDDYDYLINHVLLRESNLKNTVFEGYSYYIPYGLKFLNKEEYNALLSDSYNNHYYIYTDVVSYYHQIKYSYKQDSNAYYSKKIQNNKNTKNGYLEINQINDKYFVEAMYNYVKIEVYTDKDHLSDVIVHICEILSSVQYNDKVLETTIGDKVLNYKEESFNIFTTKKSTTNYLDYVERYDGGSQSKEDDFLDEDMIDIDTDEE